jgi:hypothetical protein
MVDSGTPRDFGAQAHLEQLIDALYDADIADRPELAQVVGDLATELVPEFRSTMGEAYEHFEDSLQKGLFRIIFEFCAGEEAEDLDTVTSGPVVAAFQDLCHELRDDMPVVVYEWRLLAATLRFHEQEEDRPVFTTVDTHFAYLYGRAKAQGFSCVLQSLIEQGDADS